MEIESKIMSNILSKNILKEIEVLPMEFREKSEEVRQLQIELNELRSKYTQKENQINKISKEIINIENDLFSNLAEISKIKSKQKLIIDSLNEDAFKIFKENFYKIPNKYQDIILIFLKYEGNLKEELNFLLIKYENLHQLLRDSYSYFKSIEEFDKEKYELFKGKIDYLKKEEKLKIIKYPFDLIIIFIDNTFRIIDINKNNKEMRENIEEKSCYKQKLFMQNKLSEEIIKEKQEKLKNINAYIKHINNILIKYKNFFGNSNNKNSNNSSNISKTKNNLFNNRYDNNDNFGSNNILFESKKLNNNKILNINNENILINSNINNIEKYKNNAKDKILLKSNIKNEEKNNNIILNYEENKNNKFYNAINNFKKKINSQSTDPNTLINNSNNIKIISIISSSNKKMDSSNIENNHIINSNSIDYNDKKQKNINSIVNQKEGKKIKIGSLSMYQSSTSKKYKNKIIKTNSFEQVESRKIFIKRPIGANDQNKSYTEIADSILDENTNKKKKNINQYKEINFLRNNKQLYYSYQMNNNEIKNMNKEKIIKEEDEKKTLVDNYNNNIIVDYKKSDNKEMNRRKNFYLSPGIYNNNRKILKMLEMNKNNDKNKNNKYN